MASETRRKIANIVMRATVHVSMVTPFRLTLFFLGIGTLEHFSFEGGINKWRECFLNSYKGALCILPFVFLGLYAFVPIRFGNIYMDSFGLLFNIALSYLANSKLSQKNSSSEGKAFKPQVEKITDTKT